MSHGPVQRITIVCDHPSLHRGFSTVGERIAYHLHAEQDFLVEYIGRYAPDPHWRSPGYRVRDLHPGEAFTQSGHRDPALGQCFRECIVSDDTVRNTVLCIGTWTDLMVTLEELVASGRRERVRLVGYLPVDFAPLPVQFVEFARGYDRIVPYTRFALETLQECCRRARIHDVALHSPIPHGVDTAVFHPLPGGQRAAVRQQHFGVGDDQLLIGYFGRNSTHKRPDLVLRLFQLFATGAYGICGRCGSTNGDALNPDGTPGSAATRCAACDSSDLTPGAPRDEEVLYLHTDLHSDPESRRIPDARDLERIAARYGIAPRVQMTPRITIGAGVPVTELARSMAACDVHVLPFTCAGFELTVLETGACGVPNLITDISSPPDYAAPFARLTPVGTTLIENEVRGLVDMDRALRSLLTLADSPLERRRLGLAGVEVARRLDWRKVTQEWMALMKE